jgi:hypothetical protein
VRPAIEAVSRCWAKSRIHYATHRLHRNSPRILAF